MTYSAVPVSGRNRQDFADDARESLAWADEVTNRKHKKIWVRIAAQEAVASGVLSFHEGVASGGLSAPLDCALEVIIALEAAGLKVVRDKRALNPEGG